MNPRPQDNDSCKLPTAPLRDKCAVERFATLSGRQSKSILRLRLSDGNTHVVSINDFHLSESKTGNSFQFPKPTYTLHKQLTLTQHRSLLRYSTTETKLITCYDGETRTFSALKRHYLNSWLPLKDSNSHYWCPSIIIIYLSTPHQIFY